MFIVAAENLLTWMLALEQAQDADNEYFEEAQKQDSVGTDRDDSLLRELSYRMELANKEASDLQCFTVFSHCKDSVALVFEGDSETALLIAQREGIELDRISCDCCGVDWWEVDPPRSAEDAKKLLAGEGWGDFEVFFHSR